MATIYDLPPPNNLQPQHNTVLWNQPSLYQFLAYFQAHPTTSIYAGLVNKQHKNRDYYDYSLTYFSSTPPQDRFYISQTLIIKHLFVIRVLITLTQKHRELYNAVLQTVKSNKSFKYTPIQTPLPADLIEKSQTAAASLFQTYNQVIPRHQLSSVQDATHIQDVLITYELIHSLYIQFNFYHRESLFLQTIELGTIHSLSPESPPSASSSEQSSSQTPELPASELQRLPTLKSAPNFGDYSSYNNLRTSSHVISAQQLNQPQPLPTSMSSSTSTSSQQLSNTSCGGYYDLQELKYKTSIDKLWFLLYQSALQSYNRQLDEHTVLHPSHFEISPTNPSTPRSLLPQLLDLIVSQQSFGLRSFALELEQYLEPARLSASSLDPSPVILPVRYSVISESKIYHALGLSAEIIPSHWEEYYQEFKSRRTEILEMIQKNGDKQPTIQELTRDVTLFPLIASALPLQLLPTISVPAFLPPLDKLKTQTEVLELNRNITTSTFQPMDQALQSYYLALVLAAPQILHNNRSANSSQRDSGSKGNTNFSLDTVANVRRESTTSFMTIPQSVIPPNAFFLRVVESAKKQPLYKHLAYAQRSTPYLCKLQNKTLFGGKDLKTDIANVQTLVLKHYTLVEELYIRYKAILSHYSFFIASHETQDNNPNYRNYMTVSRQLRAQYCPLPTPVHPSTLQTASGGPFNPSSATNAAKLNAGLNQQGELAWASLPPSPLSVESQAWLEKSLSLVQEEFSIYHRDKSFEKDELATLSARIYTHTLPTMYGAVFYLKRQSFFMNEEILILQSLLNQNFMSTLQYRFPDISMEILLTDWNDRFLALSARAMVPGASKDANNAKESNAKEVKSVTVENDPNFFSSTALMNVMKDGGKNGELVIKSLCISPLEEARLRIPNHTEVIDLETFMKEIKLITPHQKTWLAEYYPQTWLEVDRPPLPSLSSMYGDY